MFSACMFFIVPTIFGVYSLLSSKYYQMDYRKVHTIVLFCLVYFPSFVSDTSCRASNNNSTEMSTPGFSELTSIRPPKMPQYCLILFLLRLLLFKNPTFMFQMVMLSSPLVFGRVSLHEYKRFHGLLIFVAHKLDKYRNISPLQLQNQIEHSHGLINFLMAVTSRILIFILS